MRYLSWLKDDEVKKYMSASLSTTIKQLYEYYREITGRESALIFAVELRRGRKHIGNVTLQNIDEIRKCAVFGIMVGDKTQWGKGYGRLATELTVKYAFDQLGLKAVRLGVSPKHKEGIHLYKKCRFKVTRRQKQKIIMQIQNKQAVKEKGIK
tara:strand:- start:4422 stop:4880 length:459 start_codon:yes stop_codon:yes gene_type:complete